MRRKTVPIKNGADAMIAAGKEEDPDSIKSPGATGQPFNVLGMPL
jgi:hypothetical protein